MQGTIWNDALVERRKRTKTRSALHARLTVGNYAPAKRKMDTDDVSVACKDHNMERRTS